MRKAIYNTFKGYNDLVLRSDRKGNPYAMEKELDKMEILMDTFIGR